MERDGTPQTALDDTPQWRRCERGATDPARHLAERTARVLQLGLASIDIIHTRQGPMVADATSSISIALFERVTGVTLSEVVVIELEQQARARARAAAVRIHDEASC
jgi:hypothetical protein